MSIKKATDDFAKALAALVTAVALEAVGSGEPAEPEEEAAATAKAPKATAKAPKAPTPPVEDEPTEGEDLLGEDTEEPTAPTTIKEAIAAMIAKGKRDEAVALLKKVGAKSVGDVPKDKEAAVMKALLTLLSR